MATTTVRTHSSAQLIIDKTPVAINNTLSTVGLNPSFYLHPQWYLPTLACDFCMLGTCLHTHKKALCSSLPNFCIPNYSGNLPTYKHMALVVYREIKAKQLYKS